MTDRDVQVVVVAYGAPDLLDGCLELLGGHFPVTVVDNSSSVAVQQVVARRGADYLDPGRNLGFAAGVNKALARLPTPGCDVLLLNPDAQISPSGVSGLQTALRPSGSPARGAVAPALVDASSGAPQRTSWPWPTPAGMWWEAIGLGQMRPSRNGFVVGAVLLLNGDALAEVGGMDERFFLYAEETDWQRRAWLAGWPNSVASAVTARHVGAGTSNDARHRDALFLAGTETYIRKWYGQHGWWSYRAAALLAAAIRAGLLRNPQRRQFARTRARAFLLGPRRVAGLPREVG